MESDENDNLVRMRMIFSWTRWHPVHAGFQIMIIQRIKAFSGVYKLKGLLESNNQQKVAARTIMPKRLPFNRWDSKPGLLINAFSTLNRN